MRDYAKKVKEIEKAVAHVGDRLEKFFKDFNKKHCPKCRCCCCNQCAGAVGYISGDLYRTPCLDKYKDFLKKTYGFSEKTGFLTPKKGCNLPRYLRSQTCLSHLCGKAEDEKFATKLFTVNCDGIEYDVPLHSVVLSMSRHISRVQRKILSKK